MATRFRDVSEDPRAPARAEDTLGVADRLREAGFTTLGYVEDGLASPAKVYEVLISPDRGTLALPEDLFGKPHVALRTLLDDGTIVETAFERRGGIRFVPAPRVHHPGAGYELRRAPADVDRAFDAHRRHVDDVVRRRGTAAEAQDSMRIYIAMGERVTRLIRIRQALHGLALIVVVMGLQAIVALLGPGALPFPSYLLAPLLLALFFGVMWLAPGRFVPLPRAPRAELVGGPEPRG